MSEQYRVTVTPDAQSDIREILMYIAQTLAAPQAALQLEEAFRNEIKSLTALPKRIRTVAEQPWKDAGIRRLRVKNYYIYFWVDDGARSVRITAVIYTGRDQIRQLEQRQQTESL